MKKFRLPRKTKKKLKQDFHQKLLGPTGQSTKSRANYKLKFFKQQQT